jgi:hypothetical protein
MQMLDEGTPEQTTKLLAALNSCGSEEVSGLQVL